MAFIEEQLPLTMSYGAGGGPMYSTDVITLSSGVESRNANWAYPRLSYNAAYGVRSIADMTTLMEWFHAAQGRFNGFRIKDWADYKSVVANSTILRTDVTLGSGDGATTTFQLKKNYTAGAQTQVRLIKKPVAGSVLIGVTNPNTGSVPDLTGWSIDTTTGIITFDADRVKTITGATSANPCVLTSATHGFTTGDTVYLTTFTGDWAALNGDRYEVTVTTGNAFEINVDTTSFTAYSGNAGSTNTLPQSGETVTAGFEFDVPVRFDSDQFNWSYDDFEILSMTIPLVELRL